MCRKRSSVFYTNNQLDAFSIDDYIKITERGLEYISQCGTNYKDLFLSCYHGATIVGLLNNTDWFLLGCTDYEWVDDIIYDFLDKMPVHYIRLKNGRLLSPRDLDKFSSAFTCKLIETCIRFNIFEEKFEQHIPILEFD